MRHSRFMHILLLMAYLAFVLWVSLAHFRHTGFAAEMLNMSLRIPLYALLTILFFLLINAFFDRFTLTLACLLAAVFGVLAECYLPAADDPARLLLAVCMNGAGIFVGAGIVRRVRTCVRNEFSDILIH